jgi:hypothetical protein
MLQVRPQGVERKVDLRRDCSPVEEQDPLSSCNACAIVGALEYFQRREHKRKTDLSVLFLYYNARRLSRTETQDVGLLSSHAMAGLMGFGVCEDRLWPYRPDRHAEEPPQACYDDALRHEALQYARIGSFDECRSLLSSGVPVTVGSFIPRWYYDAAATSGVMPPLRDKTEAEGGGHSLLLVGYDSDAQMWLARNSWGEHYGEKGYVRISFGLLQQYVWPEDLWAVGALEKIQNARLSGPSMREASRTTAENAQAEQMAALERLKDELRRDLSLSADAAREDFRRRVSEAVDAQRRLQTRGGMQAGGRMGSIYPGEQEQDASHRKFIDAMIGGLQRIDAHRPDGGADSSRAEDGPDARLGSLRDSLRKELSDGSDDAARDFRNRLRRQEDDVASKPPRGGGDQGR